MTKQKKWRDISTALNIGGSSSAGFTLKKNYCKYILPYECRYDLDNADPAPILAQVEAAQKKDSRKSSSSGEWRSNDRWLFVVSWFRFKNVLFIRKIGCGITMSSG